MGAERRSRESSRLDSLHATVVACRTCPRLVQHREQIAVAKKPEFRHWKYWGKPVPGFGSSDARLVIVGLAPAAHGANRTGRMFTGDSSGDWLYEALHRFGFATQAESRARGDGLALADCYITAAARCAPPGNRPTQRELNECRPFLEAELALLTSMRVTLVLGRIAHCQWLRAAGWWKTMRPGDRPTFGHGRTTPMPNGVTLVSSYHPSRQNTNTGRLTRKMWYAVFRRVRQAVDRAQI